VDLTERWADGFATDEELHQAAELAEANEWHFDTLTARANTGAERLAAITEDIETCYDSTRCAEHATWDDFGERRGQTDLIRDIFGNPFRPVTFDPAWRTTIAVQLAQGMYDSRDFAAMPILADALQDAGCDNADILDHCRGAGPHVRGCWVVDLVLGKE